MKHCNKCNTTKPTSDFHRDSTARDGLCGHCKDCKKRNTRKWYGDNRERQQEYERKRRQDDPDRDRRMNYRKKYGITLERYDEMLAAQGGVCAICAQPEQRKETANLAVDHCHATGEVRGLLCSNCNRAIGLLADDPERLRSAAEYLTRRSGR